MSDVFGSNDGTNHESGFGNNSEQPPTPPELRDFVTNQIIQSYLGYLRHIQRYCEFSHCREPANENEKSLRR